MKSALLADAALAIIPAAPEFAAAPKIPSEPFGEVLDEATEGLEGAPTNEPEKKKSKDDAPVIPIVAYFCPPPQIDPVQVGAAESVETPKVEEDSASPETPQTSVIPKGSTEGSIRLDPKLF